VSGTADPSAYLAGAAGWSGVALAGTGFQNAHIGVLTQDTSTDGGGRGKVSAQFHNIQVGLNGGAAAPFDDFSASGANSGPAELSLVKWSNGGARSVIPSGGSLAVHGQMTSSGTAFSIGEGVYLGNPASANTVQADITVVGSSVTGTGASANAFIQGRYYNDGTAGGAPNSALGDIMAGVFLNATNDTATYNIGRCTDATCTILNLPLTGTFTGVTVGAGVHALLLRWDPTLRTFTFGVDGNHLTVDPTATLPVAGPANSPLRRILSSTHVPATMPATVSEDIKVNNVFVAP
jgi:hypothetical protein